MPGGLEMISGQEAANSQQRVNYVPAACFAKLYFGMNRYIVALTEIVGVLCGDHGLLLDMPTQGRLGEATGSIIPTRTQRAGIFPLFCRKPLMVDSDSQPFRLPDRCWIL